VFLHEVIEHVNDDEQAIAEAVHLSGQTLHFQADTFRELSARRRAKPFLSTCKSVFETTHSRVIRKTARGNRRSYLCLPRLRQHSPQA
jgi:hypothetical protein